MAGLDREVWGRCADEAEIQDGTVVGASVVAAGARTADSGAVSVFMRPIRPIFRNRSA